MTIRFNNWSSPALSAPWQAGALPDIIHKPFRHASSASTLDLKQPVLLNAARRVSQTIPVYRNPYALSPIRLAEK